MTRRPDLRVLEGMAIVPALRPQFALVQARRADPQGDAVIATTYDDRLLIQASSTVIMSVDEVRPGATDVLARGEQVIPAAYIDILTVAPSEDAGAATERYLESISVHTR